MGDREIGEAKPFGVGRKRPVDERDGETLRLHREGAARCRPFEQAEGCAAAERRHRPDLIVARRPRGSIRRQLGCAAHRPGRRRRPARGRCLPEAGGPRRPGRAESAGSCCVRPAGPHSGGRRKVSPAIDGRSAARGRSRDGERSNRRFQVGPLRAVDEDAEATRTLDVASPLEMVAPALKPLDPVLPRQRRRLLGVPARYRRGSHCEAWTRAPRHPGRTSAASRSAVAMSSGMPPVRAARNGMR